MTKKEKLELERVRGEVERLANELGPAKRLLEVRTRQRDQTIVERNALAFFIVNLHLEKDPEVGLETLSVFLRTNAVYGKFAGR